MFEARTALHSGDKFRTEKKRGNDCYFISLIHPFFENYYLQKKQQ